MTDALFPALVDASIRLAVVALVVEWATRRLRRWSPAAAHALWMAVLLAAIVFVLAASAVRPIGFIHPAGVVDRFFPERGLGDGWLRAALAVYVAGVLFGALRIIVGLLLIRSLVRRSRTLAPDARARVAPAQGRRAARVAFLESAALGVPVTVGFLSPRILLPCDWSRWPAERLRAVVRHELAHVRRGDYFAGLVSAAVQAVFWFHPAVWLAGRRMSLCAELACDRIAGSGAPPDQYAAHLLALAANPAPRLRYGWSVGASTALGERIATLLEPRTGSRPRPAVTVLACAALVLALLAATPLRVVPLRWTAGVSAFQPQAHQLHVHPH